MRRMRTKTALAAHYKGVDPDTNITEHFIYAAVRRGEVPCTMAGNKRLIAIEDFDKFLLGETITEPTIKEVNGIRKVSE